jgi:hypothetical protein
MVTRVDRANDRAHMFRAVVVNSVQARSHRTSNALIVEHIEHFTVSNGMSACRKQSCPLNERLGDFALTENGRVSAQNH